MRILLKQGHHVLADLFFEEEEVAIGSHTECAIHLPNQIVSPRHAVMRPDAGGGWRIEPLDEQNPTLLNDRELQGPSALSDRDEITIHDYVLNVHLSTGGETEESPVEDLQLGPEELARIRQFPLPAGAVVKRHFDPVTLTTEQVTQSSQVAVEVANARDIHELIEVSYERLLTTFNARAAWIGLRRQPRGELEVEGGRLASGRSYETNAIIELLQYRCVDRGQHISIRKVRDLESVGSAMAVPLVVPRGTLGMIYVDRLRRARRFQLPDLDLLRAIGSQIAARFASLVEGQQRRTAAVSATVVSVVHEIQATLDPKSVPQWPRIQFAAYGRSGQENPGDVYDIMRHPDVNVGAIVLGHVNATGSSLALSMARLHSTFRVGFLHKDRPHALARALGWLMHDEKDPSTVDAVFVMLDPNSGKIEYARGGKVGAFIVNPRGEPRPLSGADAPSIGQVQNYEYNSHVTQLVPRETLVLYTRGVATSTNAEGEKFGEARFIEMVCDGFGEAPSTIIHDVSTEVTNFFADGRHPDDITILLLRYRGD